MPGGGYGMARYGMDSMKNNRKLRKWRKSLKDSQYHGQVKSKIKGRADFNEITEYRDVVKRRRLKQSVITIISILIITATLILMLQ
jgi:hypothetical protein